MMRLDPETLMPYGVVLTRISGVMLAAPVFSSLNIPVRIKLFLALAMTVLLTPVLGAAARPANLERGWPIILGLELLAGLGIGLAFRWALSGMSVAGELMGMQMGLGVASTLDPMAGNNALFTDAWFSLTFVVVFLATNGHHEILRSLHASYTVLPAGQPAVALFAPEEILEQTGRVFVLGLRIAAGFMIPLMLVTFAMALISRAFPQANVFAISYTVTLLVGLLLLVSSTGTVQRAVTQGIREGVFNASRFLMGAS